MDVVEPIGSVDEALRIVASWSSGLGAPQLAIADGLLDPVGINMALIVDRILGRGWQPDGFTVGPGYRLFRFKRLDAAG